MRGKADRRTGTSRRSSLQVSEGREKYRGVVEAARGFLLGGVTAARSTTFVGGDVAGRLATRWCVVVADTNAKAGRQVGRIYVQKWDTKDQVWKEAAE